MPDSPSLARRRGASCSNCGGRFCDTRQCWEEMDRWYASHEPKHVEAGECACCGQLLPLGNVCRCETTLTGAPAFAHYDTEDVY